MKSFWGLCLLVCYINKWRGSRVIKKVVISELTQNVLAESCQADHKADWAD